MWSRLLVVLLALTPSCYGDLDSRRWLGLLPWATRDNLLQLQPHLNVKKLTGRPVPLYRPDLGEDIAYWLISFNHKEHAILSAGEHTDDNMLVLQGQGQSPVSDLQQRASQLHNATCLRYLVLTPSPDLNLACDTLHGRVMQRPLHHEGIMELWEEMKRKKKTENGGQAENNEGPDNIHPSGDNYDKNTIRLHVISASEPASFPVMGMRDSYIRPLGLSNGSQVSRQLLCNLLGVCDEQGKVQVHRKTDYGEVYVHLEPVHEDGLPRFEHDLNFEAVGTSHNGGIVTKAFVVEPFHRAKRQSTYTYYSIDHEDYMPDYNQFDYDGCQVGCGPVAWAQIFGFYDRLASQGLANASDALFRCGDDGTTGDGSCVAPRYYSNRMNNYITNLNEILGTFCLGDAGVTIQGNMDRVEEFFRERQGPSGDIIIRANSAYLFQLVMLHRDSVRDDAFDFIRQNWPVVVGFKTDGSLRSQHYAVMTQYRTRTKRVRHCTFGYFCRTKTVVEYDMYMHMGSGGLHNGWKTAKMAFAAVAKY